MKPDLSETGRTLRPGLFLNINPGIDLLSRRSDSRQYHRPQGLNDRIRNGNGCGPLGIGTPGFFSLVGQGNESPANKHPSGRPGGPAQW